jgi:hypothetical protein
VAKILQGARDEKEWRLLADYLTTQYYLEADNNTWHCFGKKLLISAEGRLGLVISLREMFKIKYPRNPVNPV